MVTKGIPTIFIVDGENRGEKITLKEGMTVIGRKEGDIILSDRKVSGRHARITFERGALFIEDLNSTNGTFVNGERISSMVIRDGDEIQVGFTRMVLRFLPTLSTDGVAVDIKDGRVDIDSIESIPLASEVSYKSDVLKSSEEKRKGKDEEKEDILYIKVKSGPGRGKVFPLNKDRFVVGRFNCDLNINTPGVGRKHFMIERADNGRLFLRELVGEGGTYVNGKRVSSIEIKRGDLIEIGDIILAVV